MFIYHIRFMICSLRYCVRTFLLIKRLPFEISNIDPYLDVIFYGYVLDFLNRSVFLLFLYGLKFILGEIKRYVTQKHTEKNCQLNRGTVSFPDPSLDIILNLKK